MHRPEGANARFGMACANSRSSQQGNAPGLVELHLPHLPISTTCQCSCPIFLFLSLILWPVACGLFLPPPFLTAPARLWHPDPVQHCYVGEATADATATLSGPPPTARFPQSQHPAIAPLIAVDIDRDHQAMPRRCYPTDKIAHKQTLMTAEANRWPSSQFRVMG